MTPTPNPSALSINRRDFLQASTAFGAGLLTSSPASVLRAVDGANEQKLVVGVMGLGRGLGHVAALLNLPNVEIGYLCEVDSNRLDAGIKRVVDKGAKAPTGVTDFRQMLDDKSLDAVFIATRALRRIWRTGALAEAVTRSPSCSTSASRALVWGRLGRW